MNTNEGYYGVTRTDEYLAHYGIKGMKWGVRKAIESGNSARLGRQYRKAQKKLAKLEARAANGKKYAKRAAALGVGAAAAGGLAAAGTGGVASAMTKIGAHGGRVINRVGRGLNTAGSTVSGAAYRAGSALQKAGLNSAGSALKKVGAHGGQAMIRSGNAIVKSGIGTKVSSGMYGAGKAVRTWGNQTHDIANISGHIGRSNNIGVLKKISHDKNLRSVSNNTLARIGAGAVGAGLGAGAAYNAYRAATTKRAAKKAAQFRSEMNKAFAGTQYGKKPRQGKRRRG